jgi:hypothetical protein
VGYWLNNGYYQGLMDEIAFYNSALDAQSIYQIFSAAIPDTFYSRNGPNGLPCVNGVPVDNILLDGAFQCACDGSYSDANCQAASVSSMYTFNGDFFDSVNGQLGSCILGSCPGFVASDIQGSVCLLDCSFSNPEFFRLPRLTEVTTLRLCQHLNLRNSTTRRSLSPYGLVLTLQGHKIALFWDQLASVRRIKRCISFLEPVNSVCSCHFIKPNSSVTLDLAFFGNDFKSSLTTPLNSWFYVSFRYSKPALQQSIVLNGVSQLSGAISAPYAGTTGDLSFGRWFNSHLHESCL